MSQTGSVEDKAVDAALEYDFVRFTLADMHGVSRGRLVPRNHVTECWKHGAAVPNGTSLHVLK